MKTYYSNNALYEQIEHSRCASFLWAAGNSWSLLYGDTDSIPKVVVFVAGASSAGLDPVRQERMLRMRNLTHELAQRASLPFGTIEFDDSVEQVHEVSLNGQLTSMDGLKTWFSGFGLPVQMGGVALKAINDASSSAYHNWQRAALGRITVTDLDLIRVDSETGHIELLYELKRSYIELDRWTPFSADFPNFNLLHNLSALAGVKFRIVYNVRRKSPRFHDDVSVLSIFSYSNSDGPKKIAVVSLQEFIEKDAHA